MPYTHLDDESLVMLTLAGEQAAYEVLVKRYQKAVTAAAYAVTHHAMLAEDGAQDAFVTAWMKLDTLSEPSKFLAWVVRIAKNCSLNLLRRYRTFLPLEAVEGCVETDDSPAEAYERPPWLGVV